MDLREFRVVVRIVDRVAKRALFAEKQRVALEGQCAEWKRIADELKAERNAAKQEAVSARQDAVTRAEADRKRIDGLMIQAQDMRAEIERLKKPRQHPVKVGESVRRTTEGSIAPIGTLGRVPPEASHITPEGKQTAEGAVMPKPGDVVRLVRVPTNDEYPHDSGRWEPNWGGIGDYMRVHYVGSNINEIGRASCRERVYVLV